MFRDSLPSRFFCFFPKNTEKLQEDKTMFSFCFIFLFNQATFSCSISIVHFLALCLLCYMLCAWLWSSYDYKTMMWCDVMWCDTTVLCLQLPFWLYFQVFHTSLFRTLSFNSTTLLEHDILHPHVGCRYILYRLEAR